MTARTTATPRFFICLMMSSKGLSKSSKSICRMIARYGHLRLHQAALAVLDGCVRSSLLKGNFTSLTARSFRCINVNVKLWGKEDSGFCKKEMASDRRPSTKAFVMTAAQPHEHRLGKGVQCDGETCNCRPLGSGREIDCFRLRRSYHGAAHTRCALQSALLYHRRFLGQAVPQNILWLLYQVAFWSNLFIHILVYLKIQPPHKTSKQNLNPSQNVKTKPPSRSKHDL